MLENETLKHYFLAELEALRHGSTRFAEEYPVVARALSLNGEPSKDPHVELLLQSFAFLTGQLRHSLDIQEAQLPAQLLESLSPQLASPLPSMAVMEAHVVPGDANFAKLNQLPRNTEVTCDGTWGGRKDICRFTTIETIDLWPLEITDTAVVALNEVASDLVPAKAESVIRLRLKTTGPRLAEMPFVSLRFFVGGKHRFRLYDALCRRLVGAISTTADGRLPRTLSARIGEPLQGESVLPHTECAPHPSLALLREYFAFPDRFLFFTVEGLRSSGYGDELEISFFLSGNCPQVDPGDLRLNCVPMVNLVRQRLEPVALQPGRVEYPLVGDRLRHSVCEVQAIETLALLQASGEETIVEPLYGAQTTLGKAYWTLRREHSQFPSTPGTEVFVTFLDADFTPSFPAGTAVGGTVWCTQRRLPESCQASAPVRIRTGIAHRGELVIPPTAHQGPALTGDRVRRLCAHLSNHSMPLFSGKAATAQLKQLLSENFVPNNARARQQVDGIKELTSCRIAERLGKEAWQGLTFGIELTVTVDANAFGDSSPLLLGEILCDCFAGFVPANSFVVLRLVDLGGELIKRWPPRVRANWTERS